MKQIEYKFAGDFDRDDIDDELMELYTIFDNPNDEPNKYTVYSETDEVFELSDYAKSFLVSFHEELINDDWKTKYKDAVRPFRYKNIYVTTPWKDKIDECENIIINPSVAFGTGDHETTILCAKNVIDYNGPKESMLDAGTGTGILAYIAYKSGFKKALGFDIDALAIESAIENREMNNISADDVEIIATDVSDERITSGQYDLIVANMITTYLKMVIPTLVTLMDENTTLILSGILGTEDEMMTDYLKDFDVKIIEKDSLNEWTLFKVAKR